MPTIITIDEKLAPVPFEKDVWGGDRRVETAARDFDRFTSSFGKKEDPFVTGKLPGTRFHRNYLGYLALCWSHHRRAVLKPDHVWFGFLTEIAALVAEAPEAFRDLFVKHEGKLKLTIHSHDLTTMPLDDLVAAIEMAGLPVLDRFLLTFSTTTSPAALAMKCAFSDVVSPYYDYAMRCCGLPAVRVEGTMADWLRVAGGVVEMQEFLGGRGAAGSDATRDWIAALDGIATKLAYLVDGTPNPNPLDWSNFFRLERCGSGGDVEVAGWVTSLFRERPSVRYVDNFPSHVARIEYEQLNTGRRYEMYHGLFASVDSGDELTPEFGMLVKELQSSGT